ncbi:MAG: hypothetical protein HY038_05285 [Nitrospirae bacterium]|nr:hypothetical protein [Nitrospirota bacterium]
MTDEASPSRPTGLILSLYWSSILINLSLPWGLLTLFEISAHRRTVGEAFRHLSLHFFAPGYHYFLIGLLSAAPFVVWAVFLLFHLGWNDRLEPAQRSRRMAGILGSLILMLGVSFWTHLSALMYPDAQGALVYFLLPYILIVLLPLGYGAGRLILAFVTMIRRDGGEPA